MEWCFYTIHRFINLFNISRLRQACSHLNLLLPAIEKDNEDSDAVTDDLDLNLAMGAISLNEPTSRSHRHMIVSQDSIT